MVFLVLLVLAVLVISVFEEARFEWCAEGEMVEDYCSSSGEDRRRRTRTRFDCGSMRIAMELFSLFFSFFFPFCLQVLTYILSRRQGMAAWH